MKSNYDKFPFIEVSARPGDCCRGWDSIAARIRQSANPHAGSKTIVVVECYAGVDEAEVRRELEQRLRPGLSLSAREAWCTPGEIAALVAPFVGGKDPVFGFLTGLTLDRFFDPQRLLDMRRQLEIVQEGMVLIVGCGASLICETGLMIYADLPRREAQLRFRRGETGNLGLDNWDQPENLKYKQAFFVDWRVCDRLKRRLLPRCDFLLDTTLRPDPKLVLGEALRAALRMSVTRPFRVVPFFDPAPWGGQWMKEVCDLDRSARNFGWCFDCVPEENSLGLRFGEIRVEIPALDLVFYQPHELLGDAVFARFGDEFPIRFDFLDTMGGGNLSLQVHPLADYIRQHFGMAYTQDESYYLLDAEPSAGVYLGLRDEVDPELMARELLAAQSGGPAFPADKYVNRFPARKHDHFLIPAGTIHCSGGGSMVLEISATPYIFTFKLWDWGRLGLDGKPRPIHLQHGLANLLWQRNTTWTRRNLINCLETVDTGEGWREEHTGLHELEFIETRRHWFTKPVPHHTRGGVHVLNLVEGVSALVESPDRAFEPFPVNYAETFIVPAAVGPYRIRPLEPGPGGESATLQASVRT